MQRGGTSWRCRSLPRANCQVFAYALLEHFGIAMPPLRSSELWSVSRAPARISVGPSDPNA
jgi:hypothetical protein